MNTAVTAKVWDEFSARLHSYIMKRVKDEAQADDILQEVFLRIHQKLETLQEEEKLKSWVFSITQNTLNDYFRQQKKRQEEPIEDEEHIPDEEQSDGNMQACLRPFIQQLPEPYKHTIMEAELQNRKYQDLADAEGLSLSAIKSRVQRGRELIKEMFIQCCHFSVDKEGKLKGEHQDPSACSICN